MSFIKLVRNRRSIRSYQKRQLSQEVIEKLLEAARLAPSGCNAQPWKYVIIKDGATIIRLVDEQVFIQDFIKQAPLLIVGCVDTNIYEINTAGLKEQMRKGTQPKDADEYIRNTFRGQELTRAERDLAFSIAYMNLEATDIGLGSCIIGRGSFDVNRLHAFLNLPTNLQPLITLTIGYSAESPEPRPRKQLSEMIYSII